MSGIHLIGALFLHASKEIRMEIRAMGPRSERVGWFSGLLMSTGFILFSCFRGAYTYMGRRVSRNAEQRKGSNDIPGSFLCLDQGSAMGRRA